MSPPIDRLGETGKTAAQSAAQHACEYLPTELLKHVRESDYQALNTAVSGGIRERLGVQALAAGYERPYRICPLHMDR